MGPTGAPRPAGTFHNLPLAEEVGARGRNESPGRRAAGGVRTLGPREEGTAPGSLLASGPCRPCSPKSLTFPRLAE